MKCWNCVGSRSGGRRVDCRENEGVRVVSPGGRCSDRVLGVDGSRSTEAFKVRQAARG